MEVCRIQFRLLGFGQWGRKMLQTPKNRLPFFFHRG